ncbi:MAG: dTDP-4-dehydrorhamnose reductase [Candidatus Cloacimonetes bacterium]|nr:dTDP-4-dehydrorhamnose reductase [Candidatus Cloacimonadota bacterium]
MPKYMIFGGDGLLAFAIKNNEFFADNIALSIKECDITFPETIEKYIKAQNPEYLINCAAYTDVTKAETDITSAMEVNAHGAINLALLANKYRCKLVHFSTDYVFKGDKEISYSEEMETNPINKYGQTKLKGEEFVRTVNPNALIIRISMLYGQNGKNFLSQIKKLLQEKSQLSLICDQFGKTTFAKDTAIATKLLIEKEALGIYHFANEGVCSLFEFTKKMYELMRKKKNIECNIMPLMSFEYPDKTPRPAWSILDTEKYKKLTGHSIRHWEEALEEYIMFS